MSSTTWAASAREDRRSAPRDLGTHPTRLHRAPGRRTGSNREHRHRRVDFFTPAATGQRSLRRSGARVPAIIRPFVMSVPAFEWRKNAENLIRAFARTQARRHDTQLVIACAVPPHGEKVWRSLVSEVGLRDDDVVITGFVADETAASAVSGDATVRVSLPLRRFRPAGCRSGAVRCALHHVGSRFAERGPRPTRRRPSTPRMSTRWPTLMDRASTDEARLRDGLLRPARDRLRRCTHGTSARSARSTAYERPRARRERRRARRACANRVAVVGPVPPGGIGRCGATPRACSTRSTTIASTSTSTPNQYRSARGRRRSKARRVLPGGGARCEHQPARLRRASSTASAPVGSTSTRSNALRRCPGIVWAARRESRGPRTSSGPSAVSGRLEFGWRG